MTVKENAWHLPRRDELDPGLRDWLLEPGSLTARIRAHCNDGFHLDVLREVMAQETETPDAWPSQGVAPRLREVTLNCGEQALVFARTLIPDPAMVNDHWLLELGNKPLGDVLFQSGGKRVGDFEVCILAPDSELGRAARVHCRSNSAKLDVGIWARRSWVELHGERLLICECFLPGLI